MGYQKKRIIKKFLNQGIETRSLWYPNHLQKPFNNFQKYQIQNSKTMFERCICLLVATANNNQQLKIVNLLENRFKNKR